MRTHSLYVSTIVIFVAHTESIVTRLSSVLVNLKVSAIIPHRYPLYLSLYRHISPTHKISPYFYKMTSGQPPATTTTSINLLLGITGSVATIKLPEVIQALRASAARRQRVLEVITQGENSLNIILYLYVLE